MPPRGWAASPAPRNTRLASPRARSTSPLTKASVTADANRLADRAASVVSAAACSSAADDAAKPLSVRARSATSTNASARSSSGPLAARALCQVRVTTCSGADGVRERSVSRPTLLRCREVPYLRSDQGVAEGERLALTVHEVVLLHLVQGVVGVHAGELQGSGHVRGRAVGGRGEQHECLSRVGRQCVQPGSEDAVERPAHRQNFGQRNDAAPLSGTQVRHRLQ